MIPQLAEWETYYVIVGSSAAALTGLMFVVITLIADMDDPPSSDQTFAAFGTPTIFHFCAALVVSATLSAPWPTLTSVAVAIGICAVAGLTYSVMVVYRARKQTQYKPVFEDWLWHTVFPFVAYGAMLSAAGLIPGSADHALFAVAGGVLLLVLIGIHNAWDTVTYLAILQRQRQDSGKS